MEYLGAVSEFDWNESEFMMAQLLGTYQDEDPSAGIESMFQPHQDASYCDWLYNTASTGSFFFPPNEFNIRSDPKMIPTAETSSESLNTCLPEEQTTTSTLPVDHNYQFGVANTISLEGYSANPSGSIALTEDTPLPKRKVIESGIDKEDGILTATPKKRARTSTQVQKNAKNTRIKKARKSVENEEKEESNASYSSENNSNASQELNGDGEGTSSNGKGKTRAGRGSATDPQSLYARKRRERINERLKILQNLVPNGTKVDISTMLEEAVQYVNFLQLQIKILSSDDMWMYAPLAYNGMDIGLDLKIPFPPQGH